MGNDPLECPVPLGVVEHDTRHETVNYSEQLWVVGDVHTKGIEGV